MKPTTNTQVCQNRKWNTTSCIPSQITKSTNSCLQLAYQEDFWLASAFQVELLSQLSDFQFDQSSFRTSDFPSFASHPLAAFDQEEPDLTSSTWLNNQSGTSESGLPAFFMISGSAHSTSCLSDQRPFASTAMKVKALPR